MDKLIYDVVINAPGSYHDAAMYRMSFIKEYLSSRFPTQTCLGDSALSIAECLITPYSRPETRADPNKALFNRRHSGARCEMTETIYGAWKRRFPVIRSLRVELDNGMDIILATAILYNLYHVGRSDALQDNPNLQINEAQEALR